MLRLRALFARKTPKTGFKNLDINSQKKIFNLLALQDPKSAVRLAAVSRNIKTLTAPKRSQIEALKKVVHRIVLRKAARMHRRIFPPSRYNNVRQEAWERGTMTPAGRRGAIKQYLIRIAIPMAYIKYERSSHANRNAAWNRFVSIRNKAGLPRITRNQAQRTYQ